MSPVAFRIANASDLDAIVALLADDAIARMRSCDVETATPEVRAAFARIQDDTQTTSGLVNAMDRVRERNCGGVQLTTDLHLTDAHRFYARIGFEASQVGMKRML